MYLHGIFQYVFSLLLIDLNYLFLFSLYIYIRNYRLVLISIYVFTDFSTDYVD